MSRPETPWPKNGSSNSGLVSRVSQTMENNRAMRVSIASARPVTRADSRRSGGSRLTRMEMKMMLSMPSTISSADNVTNVIQAWGSVSSSIIQAAGSWLWQLVDGVFAHRREHVLGFQATAQRDGAGDVDGRIRAGDDADEQGLGEA